MNASNLKVGDLCKYGHGPAHPLDDFYIVIRSTFNDPNIPGKELVVVYRIHDRWSATYFSDHYCLVSRIDSNEECNHVRENLPRPQVDRS